MRRDDLLAHVEDLPMTRWLALTLAMAMAMPAALAHAQSASEQSLARDQFREGVAAARAERWPDAVEAFQRSLELAPRAMTMMNLAGALAQVGRLVEAAEAYRMFLSEAQSGAAARVRGEAEAQLATLEARIPHVRLQIHGRLDSDTVTLDEYQLMAAAIDAPLPVDPGEHTLTIARDGMEPRAVTFTAQEGVQSEVVLEAWPDLGAIPPGPEGPDPLGDEPTPGASHSIFDEPVFWIVGSVVLAGLIAGGVAIGVTTQSAPAPYFGNLPPHQLPLE
jgi:hypothetical protein